MDLFMQTKRVLQKTARSVFLFAAVSAGSLGATEVQDIAFEEIYAVVRIESVRKPVEHSITLGDAQDGRLRMRSLIGPTQLGVSVISDNCLVGYDLASPDEPTNRHRIKVWLTKESKPIEIVVGPVQSAFLPGKMLRDGPPEGEDIKVVYEVREVLKESDTRNSTVKKICLPVEYRHHFERSVPPSRANPYVYLEEKSEDQAEPNKSIVDDFGVHSLSCEMSSQVMQLVSRYEFCK